MLVEGLCSHTKLIINDKVWLGCNFTQEFCMLFCKIKNWMKKEESVWYLSLIENSCRTWHTFKKHKVHLPGVPEWIKAATPRCNVAWKHRQRKHKAVAIDKHNGHNSLVIPLRQRSLDSFQQTSYNAQCNFQSFPLGGCIWCKCNTENKANLP